MQSLLNLEFAEEAAFFGRSRVLLAVTLALLFLAGLGLRLIQFTEPPLDYHPTRQLRGALISRALYYQWLPSADPATRAVATDSAKGEPEYEPPILDAIVAFSYLATGGENLWLGRMWSIIFWLVGGWFVFLLARRITSSDGGVVAVAYYLFLPLGVLASRSFQPDALMVMLLVITAYALLRWSDERTWTWAIAAGLSAGLTVLVKGRPLPIIVALLAGVMLSVGKPRNTLRDGKAWSILSLAALLPAIYYVAIIGRGTAGYLKAYSTGLAALLLEPAFYVRWLNSFDRLLYLNLAFLGVAGIVLLRKQARGLMLGLWFGYVLYGLALPYTIYTHDYYNLPAVPIIGLSLAPLAALLLARVARLHIGWQVFVVVVGLSLLGFRAWLVRSGIMGTDYYSEPAGWIAMGEQLPAQGSIIGLTHDYGARVAYYGKRSVAVWPTGQDYAFYAMQGGNRGTFNEEFEARAKGYDYFLVTLMGEFENQTLLKQKLFDQFPLASEGDGYLLFDLRQGSKSSDT